MKKILLSIVAAISLQADTPPGFNPMGADWKSFADSIKFEFKACICSDKVNEGGGTPAGIVVGFIEPIALQEGTNGSWEFPSFDIELDNSVSKSRGSSQQGGDGSGGFSYDHFIVYPVFSVLNFVQEFMCFERASLLSIGMMCEVNPLCKNDILAAFAKPWSLLTANPIAQALCAADCVSTTIGSTNINHMTWCGGCWGGLGLDSKFTKADNQLTDIGLNAGEEWSLGHRTMFLSKTSNSVFADPTPETGVLKSSLCQETPFFEVIKSQYQLQLAYPTNWDTMKFGTHPISLDFKDKITGSGNGVYWLWRQRDYCAGAYVCRSTFGNAN